MKLIGGFAEDVLGTQDVLIDLPHLVIQMPFLLGENGGNLASWNEAIKQREPPFGLDVTLYESHIKLAYFDHPMWVSGPCFWWPTLKSNDQLTELFLEATDDWPDAVFCEDLSPVRTCDRKRGSRTAAGIRGGDRGVVGQALHCGGWGILVLTAQPYSAQHGVSDECVYR